MLEIFPSIKYLRMKHGFTQQQVADKLNCSVPAYSKLETGATDVTHSRLRQLSGVYNMMIYQIYQHAEPVDNSLVEKNKQLTEKVQEQQATISTLQKKIIELYEDKHRGKSDS